MVDYKKFLAKPEEVVIMGEKVVIHPLPVKHSILFSELADDDKRVQSTNKLICISLKDDSLTEEDISHWASGIKSKFLEAIMNVNGYGEAIDEAKKKYTSGKSKEA